MPAVAHASPEIQNATAILSEELEEILNLRHLLEGYNSILYRYHGYAHKKNENWNYDTQSNFGRQDRHRAKYSEDEAIKQVDNIDEIFPIYGKYFNISDAKPNDSFSDVLNKRIQNIEETLMNLRDELEGNSTGKLRMNLQIVMTFVFLVSSLNLFM